MNRRTLILIGTTLGFSLNVLYLVILLRYWNAFSFSTGGANDNIMHHCAVRLGGADHWPETTGLYGLLFPIIGALVGRIYSPTSAKVLSESMGDNLRAFFVVMILLLFCVCAFLYLGFIAV